MTGSLLEAIEGNLTPETVDRVAVAAGESSPRTRNALSAAVPAILAGFIQKAETKSGAEDLFALVTAESAIASSSSDAATDTAAVLSRGQRLVHAILGDKGGRIASLVSGATGVTKESSSGILSAAMSLVAGVVGKEAGLRGGGAAGLSELLAGVKSQVFEHPSMPPGVVLALGSGLGAGAAAYGASSARPGRPGGEASPGLRGAEALPALGKEKPLWPILVGATLVVLAMAAVVYLAQRPPEMAMGTPEHPELQGPVLPQIPKGPSAPPLAEPVSQTTLTGAELAVPERFDLGTYFASPPGTYPDTFTMSDLSFESGSIELTSGSEPALDRLAKALADHPSARVRIEGHSDSVGRLRANDTLSRDRAVTVKDMLVVRGIDPARIEIEGKGEREPVAANDDPDGRMKNRRIEIVILSR